MSLSLIEIILYVEDMALMVSFYHEVLQLPFKTHDADDDVSSAYWVPFQAGHCVLALHGGGSKTFGKDAPKFVFGVENLEQERSRLQEAGVRMSEVRSPAPGVLVCDAWDPEGNIFSLEEGPEEKV